MVSKSSKKKRRSGSIKVDFTGVEASSRTIKDGVYPATISEITEEESDNGEYLKFVWEVTPKKGPKVKIYDNASLQPQALWRLRLLLESLGETVDGEMEIDPNDLVGRECEVEITNETYNNKNQPRITGFIGANSEEEEEEEETEDDEEEEKSSSKKSSKNKKSSTSKDDDDDAEEEEDEEDDEAEEDEDEKPAKKSSKSKLKIGAKVWFKDDDGKKVKGVITSLDDDTAMVEDAKKEEWEVETSELNAA